MKPTRRIFEPSMLLDIASYARRGPGQRDHLSPAEIALIHRTVTRTPEVMVKVLTRGANTLKAVGAHLAYLNRGGDLEIETDEGERLEGKGAEKRLLEDWDLDLEQHRRRSDLRPGRDRAPPRLVHKILFSMPPGTPPQKVLEAVKNFAREEFAFKHRYAMVLHTDEPHPHVHVIFKAVSEQGTRLHIRKATLRRWRSDFAGELRALGVAANATERAVRGEAKVQRSDGLYRALERGVARIDRHLKDARARGASREPASQDSGSVMLIATRETIAEGWKRVSEMLLNHLPALAIQVQRFVQEMPPPRANRALVAEPASRTRDQSPVR